MLKQRHFLTRIFALILLVFLTAMQLRVYAVEAEELTEEREFEELVESREHKKGELGGTDLLPDFDGSFLFPDAVRLKIRANFSSAGRQNLRPLSAVFTPVAAYILHCSLRLDC